MPQNYQGTTSQQGRQPQSVAFNAAILTTGLVREELRLSSTINPTALRLMTQQDESRNWLTGVLIG
jgi:hypothetical protein